MLGRFKWLERFEMRIAFSVCVLLFVLSVPARADVYRWTDDQGGVHIGNVPPPGLDKGRVERLAVGESASAESAPEKESVAAPAAVIIPNPRPVSPFFEKTGSGMREKVKKFPAVLSYRQEGGGVAPYLADLVALALAALFAYRGYRQGTLLTALGALRVICAYAGAYLLAGFLGKPLHQIFGLLRIVSTVIGGVAVFLLIALGFRIVVAKIRRKRKKRKLSPPNGVPTLPDRIGGASIGLLCGTVAAFVLCWLYSLVRAGFAETGQPDIGSSVAGRSSRYCIEQAVYTGIEAVGGGRESARQVARLIGDPGRTVEDFQRLVHIPAFTALMNSPTFRDDFLSGDYLRIRYNYALQQLFNDRSAVHYLKELGVLTDDYRSPRFQDKLAADLAGAGRRMREAMNDPGLSRAVEELRREGLFESARIPRLILDTRFLKIVDRVMAPVTAAAR